jgi:hypothetical protein
MNALNHGITAVFDALLWPLERLGKGPSLVIASGVFGVVALVLFKHLSSQKRIKSAKDKVKGHLIEIRIYQDDPLLVMKATGRVLARNVQYLGWNLLPFIPLALPFAFVIAQLVVRHAFRPVPLTTDVARVMPGQGTTLSIELAADSASRIKSLVVHYPDGVTPISPLVRVPNDGRAFQEVVASKSGNHTIELELDSGARETKMLAAGDVEVRHMQPERGKGFFAALLWPAENTFASDSPFERVSFVYPDADQGWLPSGVGGVVITFLVASMVFGFLAIKPLKIQI